MSDPSVTAAVASYLREGHAAMREIVASVPAPALDWRPGDGTNSIAALVSHAIDAERFLTALVAGITLPRDREAAFRVEGVTAEQLLAEIDAVERDLDVHLALVTPERLSTTIQRPNRTMTGAGMLLHATAHSREHIGQASLTRQLAEQAGVGASRD